MLALPIEFDYFVVYSDASKKGLRCVRAYAAEAIRVELSHI